MDMEQAREYCLAKSGVTEGFPFGPDVLVFKVAGKMFATLTMDDDPACMNLKCDPDRALELRAEYHGIAPGYHMNKRLWNTVTLGADVPVALRRTLIDESYDLVVAKLTKKARGGLGLLD